MIVGVWWISSTLFLNQLNWLPSDSLWLIPLGHFAPQDESTWSGGRDPIYIRICTYLYIHAFFHVYLVMTNPPFSFLDTLNLRCAARRGRTARTADCRRSNTLVVGLEQWYLVKLVEWWSLMMFDDWWWSSHTICVWLKLILMRKIRVYDWPHRFSAYRFCTFYSQLIRRGSACLNEGRWNSPQTASSPSHWFHPSPPKQGTHRKQISEQSSWGFNLWDPGDPLPWAPSRGGICWLLPASLPVQVDPPSSEMLPNERVERGSGMEAPR